MWWLDEAVFCVDKAKDEDAQKRYESEDPNFRFGARPWNIHRVL
jgi:hypothetical protein